MRIFSLIPSFIIILGCLGNVSEKSEKNVLERIETAKEHEDQISKATNKALVKSDSDLNVNKNVDKIDRKLQLTDKSNVIKYLPEGFSKNGDVDYTQFVQKAVDENNEILMPDFPVAINYKGISIPSNRKVEFQKNSSLIMLANDKKNYQSFLISNAQNVQIINPTLIGDRDVHIGEEGQWGMGISILSSNNVRIFNCDISKFWGDGIYISQDVKTKGTSRNIVVDKGKIYDIRRNGISVISGENVKLNNLSITDINGVLPMAAIDIEPNQKEDVIKNITINNLRTSNSNIGVQVGIRKLPMQTRRMVGIQVKNLNSVNDNHGILIGDLFRKNQYPEGTKRLSGEIKFENVKIEKSKKEPIKYFSHLGYDFAPSVSFLNLSIDNKAMNSKIRKDLQARNFSIAD